MASSPWPPRPALLYDDAGILGSVLVGNAGLAVWGTGGGAPSRSAQGRGLLLAEVRGYMYGDTVPTLLSWRLEKSPDDATWAAAHDWIDAIYDAWAVNASVPFSFQAPYDKTSLDLEYLRLVCYTGGAKVTFAADALNGPTSYVHLIQHPTW